jgi:nucleotide-binding universal stress UspA family protein
MVCIDLNDQSLIFFSTSMESWHWEDIEEVHIVHGFRVQSYPDTFYYSTYPLESDYENIRETILSKLFTLEEQINKLNNKVKVKIKCLITASAKKTLCQYAREEKITSMVIKTRGSHGIIGLFSSSFAEYMVRHAPCELRILREDNI